MVKAIDGLHKYRFARLVERRGGEIIIGKDTSICQGSHLRALGSFPSINDKYPPPKIVIGDNVRISWNVFMLTDAWIHFRGEKMREKNRSIIIQDGAWIGEGVKIRGGVTIGKCVVIGMGSVVIKDCNKPYHMYAGNPAKDIGLRPDYNLVKEIMESGGRP